MQGYTSTTVERIAMRAGLSKAGIYAHYRSKDEIFEALLAKMVPHPDDEDTWSPRPGLPLPKMVDSYLDYMYRKLEEPSVLAVFRLVLAESTRVPALLQQWNDRMLKPLWKKEQKIVDAYVKRGEARKSVLADNFMLAVAPAVFGTVLLMLFQEDSPISMAKMRKIHKRLLLESLQP